jgi:multidrug efflux system membrane fusion protein
MFARVRFPGPARPVLTVPPQAVRMQGQVATVFTVDGERARLRLVQTGLVTPAGVEVTAGLDPGEWVIVSSPPGLVDGHPVRRAPVSGAAVSSGTKEGR